MLQWQHLFPTAVLQHGREYYKKNLVRSLIRDGETYYAAVQGTREYQVTVHLRGDRIESMECECPYASDGNRCKHMAATLYEISARQIPGTRSERRAGAEKTGHVRIYPYAEENNPNGGKDRGYRYYVPARFTGNLAIYADTWEKANELLADGTMHDIEVHNSYTDEPGTGGKAVIVRGYVKKGAYYAAGIRFSRDRVYSLNCPVFGCKGYYRSYPDRNNMEICEHCLALLIRGIEELGDQSGWDSTDLRARKLIDSFWGIYRHAVLRADEAEQSCENTA
ncbi:MAG: SWIM zinc finger family protein, partial [Oscillospiraceae bacterium]|nr:SWIM zinc finger family protein [Oscillospiraceae bacterium]